MPLAEVAAHANPSGNLSLHQVHAAEFAIPVGFTLQQVAQIGLVAHGYDDHAAVRLPGQNAPVERECVAGVVTALQCAGKLFGYRPRIARVAKDRLARTRPPRDRLPFDVADRYLAAAIIRIDPVGG